MFRMSDPGTTYRTREEVQRMRSTQDPIHGLQRYIEEWGLASEAELKVLTFILVKYRSSLMFSFRKLTRTQRHPLIRMLRRLRSRLSRRSRTSGPISTTRARSRHSCAVVSVRRFTTTKRSLLWTRSFRLSFVGVV